MNSSYGTVSSATAADGAASGGGGRGSGEGRPRWTHGGDLFQDPLRYDSDDGTGPSPRQFPNSFNSDASMGHTSSYERRSSLTSALAPV